HCTCDGTNPTLASRRLGPTVEYWDRSYERSFAETPDGVLGDGSLFHALRELAAVAERARLPDEEAEMAKAGGGLPARFAESEWAFLSARGGGHCRFVEGTTMAVDLFRRADPGNAELNAACDGAER